MLNMCTLCILKYTMCASKRSCFLMHHVMLLIYIMLMITKHEYKKKNFHKNKVSNYFTFNIFCSDFMEQKFEMKKIKCSVIDYLMF